MSSNGSSPRRELAKRLCGGGKWRCRYGENRIDWKGDGVPPEQVQARQLPNNRSDGQPGRRSTGHRSPRGMAPKGRRPDSRPRRGPPRFERGGPSPVESWISAASLGLPSQDPSLRRTEAWVHDVGMDANSTSDSLDNARRRRKGPGPASSVASLFSAGQAQTYTCPSMTIAT